MNQLPLITELPAAPTTRDLVLTAISARRALTACVNALAVAWGMTDGDGDGDTDVWDEIEDALDDAAMSSAGDEPSPIAIAELMSALDGIAEEYRDDVYDRWEGRA